QLNDYLRDQGLFFPIDPGADASLGGMVSTRASGTNAVRYGTMRENVLSLEVVLADGTVIDTARRARKSSAGYDLTRLIVGAEGTLGIVTGVTLRLHGLPEAIIAGVCPFDSLDAACRAVIATIQSGIPVARIELLDSAGIRAVNLHSHLELPEQPHLFVEFHGSPAGAAEQADAFAAIVADFGGGRLEVAHKPEDRTRLWHARHEFYFAVRALRPGTEPMVTDVCVPISRLAACIEETMADVAETGLIAAVAGHVGDGNFHVQAMVDTGSAAEIAAAEAFLRRLAHRAIAMDGTCTGEHGVGQGKIACLDEEHGAGLGVMRALKLALDPAGILNPGKIVGTQRLVAGGPDAA
uniref:FAD-linked oxidase C-terminal domain-containing protein n=1 Tax=Pseudoxanthobacter sp. TaxID=1925742 RepID=UPI002FE04618